MDSRKERNAHATRCCVRRAQLWVQGFYVRLPIIMALSESPNEHSKTAESTDSKAVSFVAEAEKAKVFNLSALEAAARWSSCVSAVRVDEHMTEELERRALEAVEAAARKGGTAAEFLTAAGGDARLGIYGDVYAEFTEPILAFDLRFDGPLENLDSVCVRHPYLLGRFAFSHQALKEYRNSLSLYHHCCV